MPELDYLLDDSVHAEPYLYNKTFDQAKHYPCMVTHTSRAAGALKPVFWTHWRFAVADAQHAVPDLDGRATLGKTYDSCNRCYLGLPISDAVGISTSIMEALFNGCAIVLGPPTVPTANTFEQVLDHGRIDAANLSSTTIDDFAISSDALTKLQRLRFITCVEGKPAIEAKHLFDTDDSQVLYLKKQAMPSHSTPTSTT